MVSWSNHIVDEKFVSLYGSIPAKNEESNDNIKYHHFETLNDLMDIGIDHHREKRNM